MNYWKWWAAVWLASILSWAVDVIAFIVDLAQDLLHDAQQAADVGFLRAGAERIAHDVETRTRP